MTRATLPVRAADGTEFAAAWYRAPSAVSLRALLVFAPGAGAGHEHAFMVRHATALAEQGVDVVTFDFPYRRNGRQAPDKSAVLEQAFRDTISAARAHATLREHALYIGGKSMGGRIATHLAAAPEEWSADATPLRGVVVFGYPLNPPGGPSRRSPDRVSHLARITVPIFVAQGTRDTFGTPTMIRDALPAATVHEVLDGDHSFLVRKSSGQTATQADAATTAAVLRFITERVTAPRTHAS